jgi:cell division protein FtsI (penicillin-binding protein 3)
MKSADRTYIRMRMALVGIGFGMLLAAIASKAVYVQVLKGPWLSEKASGQYAASMESKGKRGTIFDTKMREMAVSIETPSIAAYPRRVKDPVALAKALGRTLGLNAGPLEKKLRKDWAFVWIKRKVSPKEVEAVSALGLTGVDFIPEHSRFYPNRGLAAQVLGFSGTDGNGLEGVEFYYDTQLREQASTFGVLQDALGRRFASEERPFNQTSGHDLFLTIDTTIQFMAEKALAEAVTGYQAKSGMVLVMAPHSGAILALAHAPQFNPNAFSRFNRQYWRNRAITDPFEPGSTMKIFSAAAAIESGELTRNSIFYCEDGAYRIGKDTVHDTKRHGWLSLDQIIKLSSNIGAVKVGEKIGPAALYRTLRDFGFGARTGIDCPGETPGSLPPHRRWSQIDAGAIAFGQGVSVSALQLATATSAIANGGMLMRPYMVRAIVDAKGRTVQPFEPTAIRRVVSAHTARIVTQMMESAVSAGSTGTQATLAGYRVCGKTGTAQKIDDEGRYAKDRYVASFVGFVPSDRPVLTILVIIDEPQKNHYGGTVAAPVFRKIARGAMDYLDVPPGGSNDNLMVYRRQEARG